MTARRVVHVDQDVASSAPPTVEGVAGDAAIAATSLQAVLSFVAVWVALGMLTAVVLARRGHDGRVLGALGIVFGPLLAGIAIDAVRRRERDARPIVVSDGSPGRGTCDVLVGVLGPGAAAADAIAPLSSMRDELRRVTVAVVIDFESAERVGRCPIKDAAVAELRQAALFLAEFDPALVLLPGRPDRALCHYAAVEDYEVVLLSGPAREVAAAHRRLVGEHRPTVVVAGAPRAPDQ